MISYQINPIRKKKSAYSSKDTDSDTKHCWSVIMWNASVLL